MPPANAKPFMPVPLYQIKVTLEGVRPAVWRRLLVPADISLAKMHIVLQKAMGWTGSHMHLFDSNGVLYENKVSLFGDVADPDMLDEAKTRLSKVLECEKAVLRYEYDFGDGWSHRIVLEKILAPMGDLIVPLCVAGKGACPPEDSGGPPGYAELREALADPAHPEHEQMLEWIGESFDPAWFSVDEVNAALGPWAKRARAGSRRKK